MMESGVQATITLGARKIHKAAWLDSSRISDDASHESLWNDNYAMKNVESGERDKLLPNTEQARHHSSSIQKRSWLGVSFEYENTILKSIVISSHCYKIVKRRPKKPSPQICNPGVSPVTHIPSPITTPPQVYTQHPTPSPLSPSKLYSPSTPISPHHQLTFHILTDCKNTPVNIVPINARSMGF